MKIIREYQYGRRGDGQYSHILDVREEYREYRLYYDLYSDGRQFLSVTHYPKHSPAYDLCQYEDSFVHAPMDIQTQWLWAMWHIIEHANNYGEG